MCRQAYVSMSSIHLRTFTPHTRGQHPSRHTTSQALQDIAYKTPRLTACALPNGVAASARAPSPHLGHEGCGTAPVGSDQRQTHRHGLHVRSEVISGALHRTVSGCTDILIEAVFGLKAQSNTRLSLSLGPPNASDYFVPTTVSFSTQSFLNRS